MAKEVFGEYSAFTTKNNMVRFQKNNKLVSEKALPPEVVAYLTKKLGVPPKEPTVPEPKFPRPTPEQMAKLREESLKVPVELQRTEEEAEIESFEAQAEEALTPEDFDNPFEDEPDGSFNPEPTDEVIEAIASQIEPDQPVSPDEPDPSVIDPDFLESVSIHTASIQDMVEALYERFGIYTVYLGKLPEGAEINPITGEPFSKYHLGIAYQAAIYAKNKGILSRPAENNRKALDMSLASHQNFKVDPVPQTMGDARRANSFDYRTSVTGNRSVATSEIVHVTDEDGKVHAVRRDIPAGQTGEHNGARARYDKENEQLLVEPQFGRQVIRPDW